MLLEEVQKLNRENVGHSISSTGLESEDPHSQNLLDFILDQAKVPEVEHEELLPDSQESSTELKEEKEKAEEKKAEDIQDEVDKTVNKSEEEIKEVVEEENKPEDSAMIVVIEAENGVTPQRYPV